MGRLRGASAPENLAHAKNPVFAYYQQLQHYVDGTSKGTDRAKSMHPNAIVSLDALTPKRTIEHLSVPAFLF